MTATAATLHCSVAHGPASVAAAALGVVVSGVQTPGGPILLVGNLKGVSSC